MNCLALEKLRPSTLAGAQMDARWGEIAARNKLKQGGFHTLENEVKAKRYLDGQSAREQMFGWGAMRQQYPNNPRYQRKFKDAKHRLKVARNKYAAILNSMLGAPHNKWEKERRWDMARMRKYYAKPLYYPFKEKSAQPVISWNKVKRMVWDAEKGDDLPPYLYSRKGVDYGLGPMSNLTGTHRATASQILERRGKPGRKPIHGVRVKHLKRKWKKRVRNSIKRARTLAEEGSPSGSWMTVLGGLDARINAAAHGSDDWRKTLIRRKHRKNYE